MKRRLARVMMLVCALFAVTPALADNSIAVRKALQAQYEKAITAFRARDIKALMAVSTPDMKVELQDGSTRTYADVKKSFEQSLTNLNAIKEMSVRIIGLKVKGDHAYATVEQKAVIVATVQKVQKTLSSEQTSNDTWVKTSSGWRLKYEKLVKVKNVAGGAK